MKKLIIYLSLLSALWSKECLFSNEILISRECKNTEEYFPNCVRCLANLNGNCQCIKCRSGTFEVRKGDFISECKETCPKDSTVRDLFSYDCDNFLDHRLKNVLTRCIENFDCMAKLPKTVFNSILEQDLKCKQTSSNLYFNPKKNKCLRCNCSECVIHSNYCQKCDQDHVFIPKRELAGMKIGLCVANQAIESENLIVSTKNLDSTEDPQIFSGNGSLEQPYEDLMYANIVAMHVSAQFNKEIKVKILRKPIFILEKTYGLFSPKDVDKAKVVIEPLYCSETDHSDCVSKGEKVLVYNKYPKFKLLGGSSLTVRGVKIDSLLASELDDFKINLITKDLNQFFRGKIECIEKYNDPAFDCSQAEYVRKQILKCRKNGMHPMIDFPFGEGTKEFRMENCHLTNFYYDGKLISDTAKETNITFKGSKLDNFFRCGPVFSGKLHSVYISNTELANIGYFNFEETKWYNLSFPVIALEDTSLSISESSLSGFDMTYDVSLIQLKNGSLTVLSSFLSNVIEFKSVFLLSNTPSKVKLTEFKDILTQNLLLTDQHTEFDGNKFEKVKTNTFFIQIQENFSLVNNKFVEINFSSLFLDQILGQNTVTTVKDNTFMSIKEPSGSFLKSNSTNFAFNSNKILEFVLENGYFLRFKGTNIEFNSNFISDCQFTNPKVLDISGETLVFNENTIQNIITTHSLFTINTADLTQNVNKLLQISVTEVEPVFKIATSMLKIASLKVARVKTRGVFFEARVVSLFSMEKSVFFSNPSRIFSISIPGGKMEVKDTLFANNTKTLLEINSTTATFLNFSKNVAIFNILDENNDLLVFKGKFTQIIFEKTFIYSNGRGSKYDDLNLLNIETRNAELKFFKNQSNYNDSDMLFEHSIIRNSIKQVKDVFNTAIQTGIYYISALFKVNNDKGRTEFTENSFFLGNYKVISGLGGNVFFADSNVIKRTVDKTTTSTYFDFISVNLVFERNSESVLNKDFYGSFISIAFSSAVLKNMKVEDDSVATKHLLLVISSKLTLNNCLITLSGGNKQVARTFESDVKMNNTTVTLKNLTYSAFISVKTNFSLSKCKFYLENTSNGLINLSFGTLILENNTFDPVEGKYFASSGPLFRTTRVSVFLTNNTFNSIHGIRGAIIFDYYGEVNLKGNTFKQIHSDGSLVLSSESSELSVENNIFSNNALDSGNLVELENPSDKIKFSHNKIEHCVENAFIFVETVNQLSLLEINTNLSEMHCANRFLKVKGALIQDVTIKDNEISNLSYKHGAVAYFSQETLIDRLVLSGNVFKKNSSNSGSCFYSRSKINSILLENNTFDNNSSIEKNRERFYSDSLDVQLESKTEVEFKGSNTFKTTIADSYFAILFHSNAKIKFENVKLTRNDCVKGEVTDNPHLVQFTGYTSICPVTFNFPSAVRFTDIDSSSKEINMVSGDKIKEISLNLYDLYGNTANNYPYYLEIKAVEFSVLNEEGNYENMPISKVDDRYIEDSDPKQYYFRFNGDVRKLDSKIKSVIKNLTVASFPGSKLVLELKTFFSLSNSPKEDLNSLKLVLTFAKCLPGNKLEHTICVPCPKNSYNSHQIELKKAAYTFKCLGCPENAFCRGDSVYPNEGYYILENNKKPEKCVFSLNCKGGKIKKESNSVAPQEDAYIYNKNGFCAEGYEKEYCATCKPGFIKEVSGQCIECKKDTIANFYSFVLTFSFVVIVAILVFSTITSVDDTRLTFGLVIRIMTNHIQFVTVLSIIDAQVQAIINEDFFKYFFSSIYSYLVISSGPSQTYSMKCLFNEYSEIYGIGEIFFRNSFNLSTILVYCAFNFLFWKLWYSCFGEAKRLLWAHFTLSLIIFVNFIQPYYLVDALLMLKCTDVKSDGVFKLSYDFNVDCFSFKDRTVNSDYLAFNLIVGLPLLLFLGVLYPFYLYLGIYRNRENLDNEIVKHKFRVLYRDVKISSFYWEVFSLTKKNFLVAVSFLIGNLNKTYQYTFVLTFVVIILYQNVSLKPYIYNKINNLEAISLLVIAFNLILKNYIFYIEETANDSKGMVYGMNLGIIFSNAAFILFWGYEFVVFTVFELISYDFDFIIKYLCFCECARKRRIYLKKKLLIKTLKIEGMSMIDTVKLFTRVRLKNIKVQARKERNETNLIKYFKLFFEKVRMPYLDSFELRLREVAGLVETEDASSEADQRNSKLSEIEEMEDESESKRSLRGMSLNLIGRPGMEESRDTINRSNSFIEDSKSKLDDN